MDVSLEERHWAALGDVPGFVEIVVRAGDEMGSVPIVALLPVLHRVNGKAPGASEKAARKIVLLAG